jgi:CRP-like cAMP-binding protein
VFAALTPLDRAKLAAVLDDVWVEAGSVVFEAGGHGDALYILRSGIAERRVAGSSIGRIEPPELFGELALLTDEPRSASVVALTPLQLWVLPRARFHPLLKAEPEMLLRLSAAIGRQLAGTRRALGEMQRVLDDWTYERVAELSPEERELVENAALFDHLEPAFLAEVLTIDRAQAEARLADIASSSPICTRDGDEYAIPTAIRRAITRKLEAELGHRRLEAMRRRAGLALEARGDEAGAVLAYLSAGAEGEARRCFETAPRSVRDELVRDGRLARVGWAPPGHQDGAASGDAVPTRVRSLGRPRPKLVGLLLAVCPLLLWWLPGPAGLSPEGWRALLVLVSGAILLAFDVLPDALVALLLIVGWVAPGLVEPRIGLSGFASPSWFLVLSVLAVGVAAGSTGLLYRLALLAIVHVPPGFAWRANTLALVGVVVTPSLANTTSRVALAAPLVRELAEALSYTPGSRAAAGLGQAALIGFGQMSALFITGSSVGLLTYGLLPAEVRAEVGFAAWFVGALPVHVVLYCLSMAAVVLWFRPDSTPEGGTARAPTRRARPDEPLGVGGAGGGRGAARRLPDRVAARHQRRLDRRRRAHAAGRGWGAGRQHAPKRGQLELPDLLRRDHQPERRLHRARDRSVARGIPSRSDPDSRGEPGPVLSGACRGGLRPEPGSTLASGRPAADDRRHARGGDVRNSPVRGRGDRADRDRGVVPTLPEHRLPGALPRLGRAVLTPAGPPVGARLDADRPDRRGRRGPCLADAGLRPIGREANRGT